MKRIKLSLHIWIALTSIFSFLGGWAIFSHSAKPAAVLPGLTASAPAQQTLAPIPSLDSLMAASSKNQAGLQPLPSLSLSAQSSLPVLRTRGS